MDFIREKLDSESAKNIMGEKYNPQHDYYLIIDDMVFTCEDGETGEQTVLPMSEVFDETKVEPLRYSSVDSNLKKRILIDRLITVAAFTAILTIMILLITGLKGA